MVLIIVCLIDAVMASDIDDQLELIDQKDNVGGKHANNIFTMLLIFSTICSILFAIFQFMRIWMLKWMDSKVESEYIDLFM